MPARLARPILSRAQPALLLVTLGCIAPVQGGCGGGSGPDPDADPTEPAPIAASWSVALHDVHPLVRSIDEDAFEPPRVAVAADGAVYVVGSFDGSVEIGGTSISGASGVSNLFVARFASDGEPAWVRAIEGSLSPHALAVDSQDRLVVAGRLRGPADFGAGLVTPVQAGEAFVLAYDASGELGFAKTFTASPSALGGGSDVFALAVAADDSLWLTGSFGDEVDFGGGPLAEVPGSHGTGYLAHLDRSGVHVASRAFGGATSGTTNVRQRPTGIAVDDAGDVHLWGLHEHISVDLGGAPIPIPDGDDESWFLAKLRANGEHVHSLAVLPDSNHVAAAISPDGKAAVCALAGRDFNSDGVEVADASFLCKRIGADGGVATTHVLADTATFVPVDLALAADGGLLAAFVLGTSLTPQSLSTASFDASGAADVLLVELSGSDDVLAALQAGDREVQAPTSLAGTRGSFAVAGKLEGSLDLGAGALSASSASRQSLFVGRFTQD